MSQPIDQPQREQARDPLTSWCVTAPAGAGKTELLTQRVLALLARVGEPEEILAITFTRKAAAEMQSRIIKALALASTAEPEDAHRRATWHLARAAAERDRERGWQLMRNPARLRILTIDGLCAALTRQMPVVTALGGAPEPLEDPQPLYREAVAGLLEGLEGSDPVAGPLQRLLAHLDNDWSRAERLLVNLLGKRDQWLRHLGTGLMGHEQQHITGDDNDLLLSVRERLDSTLQDIHRDAVQRLGRALGHDAGPLLQLARSCAEVLAAQSVETGKPLAPVTALLTEAAPGWEARDSRLWAHVATWLLTGKGEWRKTWDKRQGVVDKTLKQRLLELTAGLAGHPDALDALQALTRLPEPRYDDSQWQLLATLAEVLPRLVQELYWVFQRHAAADFTEVALAALSALGSAEQPGDVLLALDHQLRHVLVDEFQDTSATQWLLLSRLLEGWAEHNATGAEPRTLFIVGDGMQSIYGFREADVGLFLTAREQGVNGVELGDAPLTVNFRSSPTVVDWVNHHCGAAFPRLADVHRGAVPFAAAEPFRASAAGSEVAVYGSVDDPLRKLESARVVALIQQARTETNGEIAVLVRNRGHLAALIPALAEAGIAWRASDIDPLAQRAAVQDLLSLCRALLNPADRISWLALLRSPLCGLDLADLHELVAGADGQGRRQPIWQRLADPELRSGLSPAGRIRTDRLHRVLAATLAQRGRQSLAVWLKACWLALGGAAAALAEGQLDDAERVFERLDDVAAQDVDPDALNRTVERLFAGAGDPGARVQLMTLHRAKGLEFDTVIIPGLDRVPRSDDAELLLWSLYRSDNGREGLVLGAAPERGSEDATYAWLRGLRAERQRLEATRLLYVGATRAERKLYLLFNLNRDARGELKLPANSLLRCIWPTVESEVQWLEAIQPKGSESPQPRQLDWTEAVVESAPLKVLPLDWQPAPWPARPRYIGPAQEESPPLHERTATPNPIEAARGGEDFPADSRPRAAPTGYAAAGIGEISRTEGTDTDNPLIDAGDHLPLTAVLHEEGGLIGEQSGVEVAPAPAAGEATVAGQVLHWLLEQLALHGVEFWSQRDQARREQLLQTLLLQYGLPRILLAAETERLALALERMLADAKGQWLLFGPHRQSWQELDLLQGDTGRSIIDRCFIADDGQRWIVDYKLSAPMAGESLTLFAQRQAQLYAAQLARYAGIFSGEQVRTALYFPLLPLWLELENLAQPDRPSSVLIANIYPEPVG